MTNKNQFYDMTLVVFTRALAELEMIIFHQDKATTAQARRTIN